MNPSYAERPSRWDSPFGDQMSPEDVDRLLQMEPFCQMDAAKFPSTCSLHDILLNDSRVVPFDDGGIVIREGDYGSSAFLILDGAVRVVLDSLPSRELGRAATKKPSVLRTIARLLRRDDFPEVRRGEAAVGVPSRGVFVQDIPGVLNQCRTLRLHRGEMFGELAALSRTPRTATVIADGECQVLELRWQGLRDIMRRAPQFKSHIDRLYRANSLASHLRETPLLAEVPPECFSQLVASAEFETYGAFDWNVPSTSGGAPTGDARQAIHTEPVIAEEGHYPNGLVLIRAGFARLSRRHGHGHQTQAYLGKGQCYGLAELAYNWRNERPLPQLQSLRAVGYVDVIRLPTQVVEDVVLPSLAPPALEQLKARAAALNSKVQHDGQVARRPASQPAAAPPLDSDAVDTGLLEFLVESRLMNGTQTLIVDLERCTRCDDCVRACETAHDGNPRFVREGPRHGPFMFAHACMHCTDPVCMIGCPTGAIGRDLESGNVLINDSTCIGCSTCANSCPYDSIQMVEIRDRKGNVVRDEQQQLPILKATKCDLCSEQLGGPACQRACPHDALVRIDMQDLGALNQWVSQ